jgi:iron complex outermembrane receptor protein
VTAQRREEKLQDVPVAVTALTATDIIARGIGSTRDVLPSVPNVTYDESFTIGNSFVSIRGVAQINNADSPIAIVVDGVPQNNQKQLRMELFDVERIEVLKGPQGALYGRNAIGGALNIVTQRPTNDFKGWVDAGYGSGNTASVAGAVSGPISPDKALFRLSAAYKDSDGQIDNVYLDEKVDFYTSKDVRGRVILTPSDALEIDLRASWSNLDGGATRDASMPPNDPANANREKSPNSDVLGDSEREITDGTAKIDWHTGSGTLTSITGYTDLSEDFAAVSATAAVDCQRHLRTGSAGGPAAAPRRRAPGRGLRFASPDDQPVRWIVSAFPSTPSATSAAS